MKKCFLTAFAITLVSLVGHATAGTVSIEALDLRSTGVFGHPDAVAGTINPGPGAPTDFTLTYNNLDIDGDSTANDSVTFTVNWLSLPDNDQRLFNQGADTGFGSLDNLVVSVTGVIGTTTDSGDVIVFDGFTGGAIGAGAGAGTDNIASATINGALASVNQPDNGAFRFGISAVDFAATPTVTFTGGTTAGGSVVARHYDLQFSSVTAAIPEPGSLALLSLVGGLFTVRRRRK